MPLVTIKETAQEHSIPTKLVDMLSRFTSSFNLKLPHPTEDTMTFLINKGHRQIGCVSLPFIQMFYMEVFIQYSKSVT